MGAKIEISTKVLTPDLLPSLVHFFQTEKCSGCWCMNHRLKPGDVLEGEPARLALGDLVCAEKIYGVLAFDGLKPIGWCAFDPMKQLPGLDCTYEEGEPWIEETWSIHCISVLPSYPMTDIIEPMIALALQVMEQKKARYVEAYPPPTFPSDNSFSGTEAIFESFGFVVKDKINKFYTRMIKNLEI